MNKRKVHAEMSIADLCPWHLQQAELHGQLTQGSRRGVLALGPLHCSVALCRAAMASTKKSCLLISVLLFVILVSTVHGARLVADAKDTGADGKPVTVRTGVAGHGHGGYSSHREHNPNGPEGGTGTPAVDPHNVAARGHHHGAASRALSYSALPTFTLLGATFLVVLV